MTLILMIALVLLSSFWRSVLTEVIISGGITYFVMKYFMKILNYMLSKILYLLLVILISSCVTTRGFQRDSFDRPSSDYRR